MKGSKDSTQVAGQTLWLPSGKKIGQKVDVFHIGNTITPLTFSVMAIFFHAETNLPIGGHTKMHSLDQDTEKASVARDPGNAYLEKKRETRQFVGEANGSRVKPSGWKRNWRTENEAVSIPQSSLSKCREPASAASMRGSSRGRCKTKSSILWSLQ